MIGFDGAIRLFDFGIAGEWKDRPLRTRMGKPGYISPEQREGRADHRSDLYSLGVVLCQLCGARIDDLGPPAVPGGIPDDLAGLLDRMVGIEPRDRPPTAAAALDEAQRILSRLGGAKHGVRALQDAMTTFAPGHATGHSLVEDVNAAYRHARWVLVAGAGVLLGLSGALALVRGGSGGESPPPEIHLGSGIEDATNDSRSAEPQQPRKASICAKLEDCEASCKGNPVSVHCTQWADLLRWQWRSSVRTEPQDPQKPSALSIQISARAIRQKIIDIYARACTNQPGFGRGDPLACTRLALLAGMTAEPDLRAKLAVAELRPTAALHAACRANQPRSALACAVLYVRHPDRAPEAVSSLCKWAQIGGDNRMHCAAKIVEAACREWVPEACVVLAFSHDESQQALGLKQLNNMKDEPAASYYEAALAGTKKGLLNACYLGEAVACASLPDNLDGCPLGDCSATTDIKVLDKHCNQEMSGDGEGWKAKDPRLLRNRSACAQLLFSRLSNNSNRTVIEDAGNRSASLDPEAAKRGAAMRDRLAANARDYVLSCYLGVAEGCKRVASKLPHGEPRRELEEAARLMTWRLSDRSGPLPDL